MITCPENIVCFYCGSTGSFEVRYLGGEHPFRFQYTCTNCGLCAPIGSGKRMDRALKRAEQKLIDLVDLCHYRSEDSKYIEEISNENHDSK